MNKTAALNKLAQAVTGYIKAEQAYNQIIDAMNKHAAAKQQQKTAGIMDMFKKAPPQPKGMHPALKALIGAGVLGGGALGVNHLMGQEAGSVTKAINDNMTMPSWFGQLPDSVREPLVNAIMSGAGTAGQMGDTLAAGAQSALGPVKNFGQNLYGSLSQSGPDTLGTLIQMLSKK